MSLYAFNGTWNSEKTDDVATPEHESDLNTNVVQFRDAYDGDLFYLNGVGTRVGFVGKVFGGAFGVGGLHRLDEAIDYLEKREAAGDKTIDIVGFSRGAALALAFANRVAKHAKKTGRTFPIRFLGLFDVVGSFGIPFNLGPIKFQEYNLGYELNLPENVEYCFHAMALDERRQTFRVTRVKRATEVWFRGAHSDIGGGNGNVGLSSITLCWMLRKAAACKVPIRPAHILDTEGRCKPAAAVKWASKDLVKNAFRKVVDGDRVHHTVVIPSGTTGYNEPPTGCPREDAVAELAAARVEGFVVV